MDNGLPVTPAASMTRNLLRVADFLPFGYGFAIVSMLLRRDCKRLGDLAAATLVVHEPRAGTRIALERRRAGRPGAAARAGGSGGAHRARGARADAHRRTARRARGAGGAGVGRRRPLRARRHAARARRRAMGAGTAMMTPLQFEELYEDEWAELETAPRSVDGREARSTSPARRVRRTRRGALPARLRAPGAGAGALLSRRTSSTGSSSSPPTRTR